MKTVNPNPIYPIVHLNGSSANSLLEGAMECRTALAESLRVLAANTPNSRDYYTHAMPGAYQKARDHHCDLAARIQSAMEHFTQMAEHIMSARDGELSNVRLDALNASLSYTPPVGHPDTWWSYRTEAFDATREKATALTANEIADLYARFPDAKLTVRPAMIEKKPVAAANNEAPLPDGSAAASLLK